MKTYKRLLMSFGVAALVLSSCDTKFDEINNNPNKPVDALTSGIMTMMQYDIAYNYYDAWQGLRMNGVICQHWSQRIYTLEDRYDFSSRTGTVSNFFNLAYKTIELGNKIASTIEKDPMGTLNYGDHIMQISTMNILKAFLIEQNVETYGDVPYRDANNILEIAQPKYDTQEFIFKDLLKQLKKANDDLKGTKGWTKGDIIFNGDVDKWRKFANSLRLRIAMRISNVDPAFSKAEAAAAIADGVMESNADNAVFHFIGPGKPNEAPLYSDYESRFDFTPTWQFTNMLLGNDDKGKGFVNPFNGIIDPRLKQIAVAPMNQDSKTYNTEGMPYGLDDGSNSAVWDVIKDKAIYYGPTKGKSDEALQKPIQAKFWSTLMDYTNVVLFQAELNNNDRSLFQKGVEASLATWGVPDAEKMAYVSSVMSKFDAANDEVKYEMIITQKYIHNFAHFDQEALHEYRRTELPKMLVLPGEQTGYKYTIKVEQDNGEIKLEERTFKFIPDDGSTKIMQRMLYPVTEGTFNRANLNAAIASMGGDDQKIPLYYSKTYKKK